MFYVINSVLIVLFIFENIRKLYLQILGFFFSSSVSLSDHMTFPTTFPNTLRVRASRDDCVSRVCSSAATAKVVAWVTVMWGKKRP